jgi:prevent-host-death family protein
MLIKTVRSEEARTHLRDVLDEVTSGETEVIIERHGKPTVAVISYREYVRIRNERELSQARIEADGALGQSAARLSTTGPNANYWNPYIGMFANEEWERPSQDPIEQREAW